MMMSCTNPKKLKRMILLLLQSSFHQKKKTESGLVIPITFPIQVFANASIPLPSNSSLETELSSSIHWKKNQQNHHKVRGFLAFAVVASPPLKIKIKNQEALVLQLSMTVSSFLNFPKLGKQLFVFDNGNIF